MMPLAPGTPRDATCTPNTMLYLGADLDIAPLHYLRSWERRAVLVDWMQMPGLPPRLFDEYEQKHGSDNRSGYKMTSQEVRLAQGAEKRALLAHVLQLRLQAHFSDVIIEDGQTLHPNAVRITFSAPPAPRATLDDDHWCVDASYTRPSKTTGSNQMSQDRIELQYLLITEAEALFSDSTLAGLAGKVSTVVVVGMTPPATHMEFATRVMVPSCIGQHFRLIGDEPEALYAAQAHILQKAELSDYPLVDTLAGTDTVKTYCAAHMSTMPYAEIVELAPAWNARLDGRPPAAPSQAGLVEGLWRSGDGNGVLANPEGKATPNAHTAKLATAAGNGVLANPGGIATPNAHTIKLATTAMLLPFLLLLLLLLCSVWRHRRWAGRWLCCKYPTDVHSSHQPVRIMQSGDGHLVVSMCRAKLSRAAAVSRDQRDDDQHDDQCSEIDSEEHAECASLQLEQGR